MCNCISDLEQKVSDHLKEKGKFKKQILSVNMKGKTFSLSNVGIDDVVVQEFEIELEGQKKRPTTFVRHSFCPFCGEKKTT